MKDHFTTFVNTSFLNKLFKIRDESLDNPKLEWSFEILRFLRANCKLVFDIEKEKFIVTNDNSPYYNPNYKYFWKSVTPLSIEFNPGIFNNFKSVEDFFSEKVNEIFFLSNEPNFCNYIEKKFGLICTDMENMEKKLPLLCSYAIEPINDTENYDNWSFLKKYNFPSNAAIIADRYILSNDKNMELELNLLGILEQILPDELNQNYHLTIFTLEIKNPESALEKIRNELKKRFNYDIKISICILKKSWKVHDRDTRAHVEQRQQGQADVFHRRGSQQVHG